jgi:S1-C subfamily serine protease
LFWIMCGGCRGRVVEEPVAFAHLGLALAHPAFLERPMPVTVTPPLLVRAATWARPATGSAPAARAPASAQPRVPGLVQAPEVVLVPYHVELRAPRPAGLRLEIAIERRPAQPRVALALARSVRHGASLLVAEVASERIAGQPWQRTRFVHVVEGGRVDGIEYAALAGPYLYRVTAYGPPGAVDALAARVAPTLRLDAAVDPALTAPPPEPAGPDAVQRAAAAVVVVVAADVDTAPGQPALAPVAVGSGVVVHADAQVLVSLHTLHDERRDALHDLFIIGHAQAGGPSFVCAGRPGHGQVDRALDLALIQCELDMSGEPFAPVGWAALAVSPGLAPGPGAPLWVLGHAADDDGWQRPRAGRVIQAGVAGAGVGSDLIAIDVAITPGMSGGAAVDERGALVGVVQGFRERFQASSSGVRAVGRIGLVRPAHQVEALIESIGVRRAPQRRDANRVRAGTDREGL